KITDFDIGAQPLFTVNQSNGNGGKFPFQVLDFRDGRIIWLTYPKNDLVFGIVLHTVRAEALIHLGIGSLQRLEDGNRRERCGAGIPACRFSLAQEASRAPQTHSVIDNAAAGRERGDDFNAVADVVEHSYDQRFLLCRDLVVNRQSYLVARHSYRKDS